MLPRDRTKPITLLPFSISVTDRYHSSPESSSPTDSDLTEWWTSPSQVLGSHMPLTHICLAQWEDTVTLVLSGLIWNPAPTTSLPHWIDELLGLGLIVPSTVSSHECYDYGSHMFHLSPAPLLPQLVHFLKFLSSLGCPCSEAATKSLTQNLSFPPSGPFLPAGNPQVHIPLISPVQFSNSPVPRFWHSWILQANKFFLWIIVGIRLFQSLFFFVIKIQSEYNWLTAFFHHLIFSEQENRA